MGNGGKSWKVDKPRDSGFKSDRDRQAGRQMARERESGKQPEKQTDNQGEKEAASQQGRGRQAGRHHHRTKQVEGQAAARSHEVTRKQKEQGQVLTGWGRGVGLMDMESGLGTLSGPLVEAGTSARTGRHLQLQITTRGRQRCLAQPRARDRCHMLCSVAPTQVETGFSVLG